MKHTAKAPLFRGIGTALITPFSGGEIDFPALGRLIDAQIGAGIPALIIGGTTGEAATLTDGERYALFRFARERAGGKTTLIFGTGTNDTRKAILHAKTAQELGADGILVVTPYYNKGTEAGLLAHYRAIAAATDLPMILYNVPSRTGVNLSLPLLEKLSALPSVAGIKEASDSADRLTALASLGDDLPLYAGNDSQTFSVLALGGAGVISVVSNLCPGRMMALYRAFCEGDLPAARKEQFALLPLISALFAETNPAPVKFAMAERGICSPELRLPLALPEEATKAAVRKALQELDREG